MRTHNFALTTANLRTRMEGDDRLETQVVADPKLAVVDPQQATSTCFPAGTHSDDEKQRKETRTLPSHNECLNDDLPCPLVYSSAYKEKKGACV